MSALESLPLAGTIGAVFGSACTALAAWAKSRSQAKTATVTAHAREVAATEETERAELALVPSLMAEIRLLRAEQRADREKAERERERCREETAALRAEIEGMRDEQQTSVNDRAELRAEVDALRAELARWQGAVPAGAD